MATGADATENRCVARVTRQKTQIGLGQLVLGGLGFGGCGYGCRGRRLLLSCRRGSFGDFGSRFGKCRINQCNLFVEFGHGCWGRGARARANYTHLRGRGSSCHCIRTSHGRGCCRRARCLGHPCVTTAVELHKEISACVRFGFFFARPPRGCTHAHTHIHIYITENPLAITIRLAMAHGTHYRHVPRSV